MLIDQTWSRKASYHPLSYNINGCWSIVVHGVQCSSWLLIKLGCHSCCHLNIKKERHVKTKNETKHYNITSPVLLPSLLPHGCWIVICCCVCISHVSSYSLLYFTCGFTMPSYMLSVCFGRSTAYLSVS